MRGGVNFTLFWLGLGSSSFLAFCSPGLGVSFFAGTLVVVSLSFLFLSDGIPWTLEAGFSGVTPGVSCLSSVGNFRGMRCC